MYNMTVRELKVALSFYPDDYTVFIVDSWKDWPYTLIEQLGGVRPVISDIDGGTFDWSIQPRPEDGLPTAGILLMPEMFEGQKKQRSINPENQ